LFPRADVVICSLGSRYKFYCSNVARTYLINPSKEQEDNYKLLEKLRAHIIAFIKPGLTCADVYNEAVAYLDKHKPELRDHLTKNLGFGVWLLYHWIMNLGCGMCCRMT
jgi:nucleosome binding factor SPN SPT16 subunit